MKLKKNHLLAGTLISALMLGACSSASADTNLGWEDDKNEGKAIVNDDSANSKVKMEAQQAVDKAKEQFDGEVQEVELDEDDGRYYYEVELQNGKEEYNVDIDANDLTILEESFDQDDDSDDDRDDVNGDDNADDNRDDDDSDDTTRSAPANNNSADSAIISSTEALKIAQNEVGGEVSEWDYDEDDGEYEVELISNGIEHELTIDAKTGDVVEFDD